MGLQGGGAVAADEELPVECLSVSMMLTVSAYIRNHHLQSGACALRLVRLKLSLFVIFSLTCFLFIVIDRVQSARVERYFPLRSACCQTFNDRLTVFCCARGITSLFYRLQEGLFNIFCCWEGRQYISMKLHFVIIVLIDVFVFVDASRAECPLKM